MSLNCGDAVICIDAADLPIEWKSLTCGAQYVIRSVETLPNNNITDHANNIHKNAKYGVTLFGIINGMNPVYKRERVYAESRFEKIQPNTMAKSRKEYIKEAA